MNLTSQQPWFNGAVVYHIYLRSFKDSNEDGVGDLPGITQKLDYLNDGQGGGLGVQAMWISPFYPSPMVDYGYDISDYRGVDPLFGTMEDLEELITEAHKRGIKVIIDLVPNHSSDQHPWFKQACTSRDHPKRDWYIWRDAGPDGSLPNNWLSVFGGSVWEWHEPTGQYYLHSFTKEQPDLNWENPEVRQAMSEVMRFWLDKGIDGFRVDAVDLMGKDLQLRDDPPNPDLQAGDMPYEQVIHKYSRDAGNFFSYIQQIVDTAGEYPDRLVVLETWMMERAQPALYWDFYRAVPDEICIPFNLELMFMEWSATEFQNFVDEFQSGLRSHDHPLYVLSNHDLPRLASAIGSEAARTAAVLLLTLPGVALLYYGEELGMENISVTAEEAQDFRGRDRSRSPMQWSDEPYAGFSSVKPWLPVSKNYPVKNVKAEKQDERSLWWLHKRLIQLRNTEPALKHGSYNPGSRVEHPDIMSYTRCSGNDTYLVILNFKGEQIYTDSLPKEAQIVLSSNSDRENSLDNLLLPHEGLILKI